MSIIDDMIADGVNINNFQDVVKYFFDRGKVNDDEFNALKQQVEELAERCEISCDTSHNGETVLNWKTTDW